MIAIYILAINLITISVVNANEFSYDGKTGPENWDKTCKGKHQSPIDIDVLHVKKVKLPPLKFENFDIQPESTTVTNNGHTVMFTVKTAKGSEPTIDGGPFKTGKYVFSQLHFHWGDNDTYGSEDSFNGKHFPMELHVVFYKQKYGTQENALKHEDGLAVLAFFFVIAQKPNPSYVEVSKLLKRIISPNTNATFEDPLALEDYMHSNMHEYYVYNGSLTTPPCLEVVTWLDFYNPIQISHSQLENFRSLQDNEGNLLSHNFRPVQPIGDRIVWLTSKQFDHQDEDLHDEIHGQKKNKKKRRKNSSSKVNCSLTALFLSMMLVLEKIF
ncbi:hypothetical protein PVAND_007649 [Polypedilum vanderplanki]|uniref:carbonic anhydrase n=1 Tax=Polypedilum vanderplanki TaxID=319348 RepID=A0A9J6C7L2_POLVA|nr:hypothetical protein PVAND_007649 [Polypedilum vanderplanki]